jgi:NAD(P)-dependent dehydrogenase (short-subunit alcohol dehydrogenase family)
MRSLRLSRAPDAIHRRSRTSRGRAGPFTGKITEAAFDLVSGVNVKGTGTSADAGRGSIVLKGSSTASMGMPAFSVYSARAAIRNLVRSWALDPRGTGIRVNVPSPGPTETPGLLRGLARTGNRDAAIADRIARTPLGRMSNPGDIAAVALFLASDESASMTGSETSADGGMAQV